MGGINHPTTPLPPPLRLPTSAACESLCLSLPSPLINGTGPKETGPFAPITDDPKLPRVLLIGDSISIGYTLPAREFLKGKANLHRIPTNGGPTTRGRISMRGSANPNGPHPLQLGPTRSQVHGPERIEFVPQGKAANRRCLWLITKIWKARGPFERPARP